MAYGIIGTDNTDGPSSDYPFGKVRDKNGSTPGTPANTKTLGDFHQFFAKMLSYAGIIANGLPDNNYSGFQYFSALLATINTGKKTIISTTWNMDTTKSFLVAHGLTSAQAQTMRILSVMIFKSGSFPRPLCAYDETVDNGSVSGGVVNNNSTHIQLMRLDSGSFDSAIFTTAFAVIDIAYTP